ncbi:MAG: tyrosine-type recombinase/integrase [Pseudomonadota bacterium]|jgi:integrase
MGAPVTGGTLKRPRRLPPFVQARGPGRFRGWAMVGGRRVYGPSRTDANSAHLDAIALRRGDAATPTVTKTLRQAADAMHDELAGLRRDGTVAFYRAQARAVFRFIAGDLPLARLTPAVLQELVRLAQLGGFSARTIQHYRRWLNRLVLWCQRPHRQWFTGDNPVPLASWPEPRRAAPDVFGEAELAARLEQLREVPADYDLVLFLAYSGLRRAEFARLSVHDFDFDRLVFAVTGKTDNQLAPITAPMLQAARNLVERAAAAGEPFVVSGTDERRRVQTIDRVFRRWAKRFGDRRFHPHALRHSLATNMIRNGVDAGTVQRMLRHASYATTQTYVHLVAADLHGAAGRLRYGVP